MDDPTRARNWKRWIQPRLDLTNDAPVLYSTSLLLQPSVAREMFLFAPLARTQSERRRRLPLASGFWTYIDARDAAMTCRLALEAKFKGHQVFIASAAKNCMIQPTRELVQKYLPNGMRFKKIAGTHWSCVDSAKAWRILGFKLQHLWQDYLPEGREQKY